MLNFKWLPLLVVVLIISCGFENKKLRKPYTIITTRVDSVHSIEFRNSSGDLVKEFRYKESFRWSTSGDSKRESMSTVYQIEQNSKIAVVDERTIFHSPVNTSGTRKLEVGVKGIIRVISNRGKVVWEKQYQKPDTSYTSEGRNNTWGISIDIAKESDFVLIAQGIDIPHSDNFAYVVTGDGSEMFDLSSKLEIVVGVYQASISYNGEYIGFLLNEQTENLPQKFNYFHHIPSDQDYYDTAGKKIWSIWDNGLVDYRGSDDKPERSSIKLNAHVAL